MQILYLYTVYITQAPTFVLTTKFFSILVKQKTKNQVPGTVRLKKSQRTNSNTEQERNTEQLFCVRTEI